MMNCRKSARMRLSLPACFKTCFQTPSNTADRMIREFTFPLMNEGMNGSFPLRTTAWGLTRNTRSASLPSSSVSIPIRTIPAPAWGFPCASDSWNAIAAICGSNPSPARAQSFILHYPRRKDTKKMAANDNVRPIEILLIEDNPGDADLARDALETSKIYNSLYVVGDGEEAMAYLHGQGEYADAPHPDLILLDLNLPKKDGREVLAEIKADDDLRRVPVVVLTTSSDEQDILKSYNLHANCYITKPIDLEQFIRVVQSIQDFWFSIVVLPPNGKKNK